MDGKTLVQMVSLGASVAEFDENLDKYFVETQTFASVLSDDGDIISGDKGTGKTAIYRILKKIIVPTPAWIVSKLLTLSTLKVILYSNV